MTKYYIDQRGEYYGGDKQNDNDIEVFERTSIFHIYKDGKWILDEVAKNESDNEIVKKNLIDIDIASIRSIREYISSLKDCPEELKQHESVATAERSKLK